MRKVFKASPACYGRSRASRNDRVKSKLLRPPVTLQLRAGDHVAFPSLGPTYNKGSNATAEQADLTNPRPMTKGSGHTATAKPTGWDGQNMSSHICRSPPGGWSPSPSPDLKTLLFSVHTFHPNDASTPARAQA